MKPTFFSKKIHPAQGAEPVERNRFLFMILPALIAGAMLITSCSAPSAAEPVFPAEINVQQAFTDFSDGAYLLDVRTPGEWNEAHIEGATLIPLNELENRINEIPQDREIIVVCRSGNRSQQGRDVLLNAGFTQVSSMAGGLTDWRARGYPTVSGP